MEIIEIIIALVVLAALTPYINYILVFFNIIPSQILNIIVFAIAISIVLFVIHRK